METTEGDVEGEIRELTGDAEWIRLVEPTDDVVYLPETIFCLILEGTLATALRLNRLLKVGGGFEVVFGAPSGESSLGLFTFGLIK